MQDRRSNIAPAIIGCLAVAVLLPALYLGAYVGLADTDLERREPIRLYRSEWLATAFMPAAAVESALIGR